MTTFFTVADLGRKKESLIRRFVGGEVIRAGQPVIGERGSTWIILNPGTDPTNQKPTMSLVPRQNPDYVETVRSMWVTNISEFYPNLAKRSANVQTEPRDNGREGRCYLRDAGGGLIKGGRQRSSWTMTHWDRAF